jgi:hypothetical protein
MPKVAHLTLTDGSGAKCRGTKNVTSPAMMM